MLYSDMTAFALTANFVMNHNVHVMLSPSQALKHTVRMCIATGAIQAGRVSIVPL